MKRDNSYLKGNQFAKGATPNNTAFKRGSTPWNKGKHVSLSPRTQFKRGQRPATWKDVGTVTIRSDKNGANRRWIKISNKPPEWQIYSQWLWIKHHGPIPHGFIVHHLDHDSMNDRISNYGLVTRGQHINDHRAELIAARRMGQEVLDLR